MILGKTHGKHSKTDKLNKSGICSGTLNLQTCNKLVLPKQATQYFPFFLTQKPLHTHIPDSFLLQIKLWSINN